MYTIQKTETVKRSPSKVKVFFEDNSYIISVNTFAHFALYDGKEITQEELEEILSHDLRTDLYERVVNYISYSPRTESQVKQYIRKYFKKIGIFELNIDSESLIDEIVNKLKEYKYINDRDYAEMFVKSRLKNKPRSRYFLLSELLSKGIDKQMANEVLDILMPDSYEVLKMLYEKKYRDEPMTFDDKKKISYLQRKGFLWDDISKFVNSFKKDNDN